MKENVLENGSLPKQSFITGSMGSWIIDAHLHISQEDVEKGILQVMEKNHTYGLVAASHPKECKRIENLARPGGNLLPTYGLHPWYADSCDLSEMMPYLETAKCIGEIGMDSVWCHVDLPIQRKVFINQLDLAEEKACPVILHTKGQEKEIGEIIRDYSMPLIVHWYSCDKYLDLYRKKDCYFTVGPDVKANPWVQQMVKTVPINRLFVESDGLSALKWALGKDLQAKEQADCLIESMNYVAEAKGLDFYTIKEEMIKNFENLFGKLG